MPVNLTRISTIPSSIVSSAPSQRYATAFVTERSSGPRWIGSHGCWLNSSDGIEVALGEGGLRQRERERAEEEREPPHWDAPKYVSSESPSWKV